MTRGTQAFIGLVIAIIIVIIFATRTIWLPAPSPTTTTPAQQATITLDASSSLPTSIAAGEFANFSFTIRNAGSEQATYQYKVSVTWKSGESDVIDENVLTLAPDTGKSIPESLKFETAGEKATITAEIVQTKQQIMLTIPRS